MAVWVQNLLVWFSQNRRAMPWRDDPSPYNVWISENMLQQTRVAAVIPYFERFITRFPTVQDLARADLQEVLTLWEGLGYYARARHLLAAAQQICSDFKGCFPSSKAEWIQLPGVGDYAAAAIASIVNSEAVPAIDGNVLRVFSRFRGIRDVVTSPSVREDIRRQLTPHIRAVDPSAFNQAMMELGALVCSPTNPRCDTCPLRAGCVARRKALTGMIPCKTPKAAVPHYTEVAAIIYHNDLILVCRRPVGKLLGGMWEFPGGRREGRESLQQTLINGVRKQTGITTLADIHKIGTVKHTFSHFSQTIQVYGCRTEDAILTPPTAAHTELRWCTREQIGNLPFSNAQRRITRHIR